MLVGHWDTKTLVSVFALCVVIFVAAPSQRLNAFGYYRGAARWLQLNDAILQPLCVFSLIQ
jgi:predicted Co/Zn/Cd cation transporter (cation efflux family)